MSYLVSPEFCRIGALIPVTAVAVPNLERRALRRSASAEGTWWHGETRQLGILFAGRDSYELARADDGHVQGDWQAGAGRGGARGGVAGSPLA